MAKCRKVVNPLTEQTLWDATSSRNETLFISCTRVSNSTAANSLLGHDCFNASLVQPSSLKNDSSLAQLMDSYQHPSSRRLPEANGLQVPNEPELVIYNRSKLLVNLEVNIPKKKHYLTFVLHFFKWSYPVSLQFCVNTLRDECREFFAIHGRDGRDLRAQAHFPCYYSEKSNDTVLTKFNRKKSVTEFALTSIIPAFLFVFSCTCLVLCTKVSMTFHQKLISPLDWILYFFHFCLSSSQYR